MQRSNRILNIKTGLLLAGLMMVAWSNASAGPIGYLQIDGRVDVQAAGATKAVQVNQAEYTVFSGDRVVTPSGSTVLTLDRGGALGLAPSSGATVRIDESSDDLVVDLENGTLLFSLPAGATSVRVAIDGFVLRTQPRGARAIRVSSAESSDLIGMVRRLDDGHIRVSMTDGEVQVLSGNGSTHQVRAGEGVGLLAATRTATRVNTQTSGSGMIRIEAPEQVGTNEAFRMRWDGSAGPRESYITIAPEGADPEEFERVLSTSEGNTLEFEAPGIEGDYEIRYVDGQTGEVSSFVYLQVVGERAAVPWIASNQALVTGVIVAAAGGAAVLILDDDDQGPNSVSP